MYFQGMIKYGQYQKLTVQRFAPQGAYLSLGEEHLEILLPQKYVDSSLKVGSAVMVFLYHDSEGRPVATTLKPFATADQFACLTVKEVSEIGAFLDIGLEKDLFMPFAQMLRKPIENRKVVVRVLIDEVSGRLIATAKLRPFFDKDLSALRPNQKVTCMVYSFHELGALVIIDNRYSGMIHKSEFKQPPAIGAVFQGYIRRILPDEKIDVSLAPAGAEGRADAQGLILQKLQQAGGFLPFHDKTPPEVIQEEFGMSKKTFKKLVGNLLKQGKIVLADDGIRFK
jgi:predicted RNA-binding protein (virulence factor B family)